MNFQTELETLIRARYPDATFRVERGQDDPEAIQLVTTVDVEDTDEVLDAIADRVMELQIEHDLPVFVIPVRSRKLTTRGASARHKPKPASQ